jgi:hypothetical protein
LCYETRPNAKLQNVGGNAWDGAADTKNKVESYMKLDKFKNGKIQFNNLVTSDCFYDTRL